MNKKWFLGLALSGSVAILAACGGADESADNIEEAATQEESDADNVEEGTEEAATEEGAEAPAAPEPDLEGIPDVVAEVNGEEITKEEFESVYTGQFQQMAMQAQMTGQEVDQDQLKEQLLESMIGQELLIQEADNRNLTASEEEVNASLEELAQQNGLASTEEFLTALEEQGLAADEVRTQVETQVKVEKLIAEEAGEIQPTEEELQELYDQVQAQQEEAGGGELPAFEEIKPDLEQQLVMQKESEAIQALVSTLRESADVTTNL